MTDNPGTQNRRGLLVAIMVTLSVVATVGTIAFKPMLSQQGTLVRYRGVELGLPQYIPEIEVSSLDIADIAAKLNASEAEVSYAAFAFNRLNETDPEVAVNIQLSMERGKLGFDWVLLGQPNIDDLGRFRAFLDTKGVVAADVTRNGVRYFRVEEGNVAELAASVVTDMYGLPADSRLGLYHEGFEWPPSRSSKQP